MPSHLACFAHKKRGGPGRPFSFPVRKRTLEVDLRADPEVAAEDVRTAPGGVEAEDAVGTRRVELRIDVEHVQHIEVHREDVVDAVTRIEVDVPLRALRAV